MPSLDKLDPGRRRLSRPGSVNTLYREVPTSTASTTQTVHISFTDNVWSFSYPSSTTYGQLKADVREKLGKLLRAYYPVVFHSGGEDPRELELTVTPEGPDITALGRMSAAEGGSGIGVQATWKSNNKRGTLGIYAGLAKAVQENVRLLEENRRLRERSASSRQGNAIDDVRKEREVAQLRHAEESKLAAMMREQAGAYEMLRAQLAVVVGQNECLKQKQEETQRQNQQIQQQLKVLQKHNESIHRQLDQLQHGQSKCAQETQAVRQQYLQLAKQQQHLKQEVWLPTQERVDTSVDSMAMLAEQLHQVREDQQAAQTDLHQWKDRWREVMDVSEDVNRQVRRMFQHLEDTHSLTANVAQMQESRREETNELVRAQQDLAKRLDRQAYVNQELHQQTYNLVVQSLHKVPGRHHRQSSPHSTAGNLHGDASLHSPYREEPGDSGDCQQSSSRQSRQERVHPSPSPSPPRRASHQERRRTLHRVEI